MSEQSAPYGPYGDIPARVDQLEKVKRAIIDRLDRQDTRFTGLEVKMDQLHDEMKIIVAMFRDQQAQLNRIEAILSESGPPKAE